MKLRGEVSQQQEPPKAGIAKCITPPNQTANHSRTSYARAIFLAGDAEQNDLERTFDHEIFHALRLTCRTPPELDVWLDSKEGQSVVEALIRQYGIDRAYSDDGPERQREEALAWAYEDARRGGLVPGRGLAAEGPLEATFTATINPLNLGCPTKVDLSSAHITFKLQYALRSREEPYFDRPIPAVGKILRLSNYNLDCPITT